MRRTLAALLTALLTTALVAALAVLAPGAAHAASASKRDPNDTQGRLDVKRVALKTQGKKLRATITTWDAFTAADLQGGAALGVDFKVGKQNVRSIAVRAVGGRLRANICTFKPDVPVQGWRCAKVAVKRVNATTVRVTVARAKIVKGAKVYRWRGGSFAPQGVAGCSTSPFCLDTMVRNPDTWFRLRA